MGGDPICFIADVIDCVSDLADGFGAGLDTLLLSGDKSGSRSNRLGNLLGSLGRLGGTGGKLF